MGHTTVPNSGDTPDDTALLAHPSAYGVSGVMTFIATQDGRIYQKDLGPDTEKIAAQISSVKSDPGWRRID
jgi:hypothetical protein